MRRQTLLFRGVALLGSCLLLGISQAQAFLPCRSAPVQQKQQQQQQPLRVTGAAFGMEEALQHVIRQHETEMEQGFTKFGRSGDGIHLQDDAADCTFSDADFDSFSVGPGNAGPTETALERGDEIFRTKSPIVSKEKCQELIQETKQVIARQLESAASLSESEQMLGETAELRERTNAQLNEAKVSDLTLGKEWLHNLLHSTLFPMLESRFGLDASSCTLNDALIIEYVAPSRSQPIHRDASVMSLQIALSPMDHYSGGGTYFEAFEEPILMEQGHVLCHSSGSMHAGRAIDSGERWVLVLFVLSEKEPQVAKRCDAEGMNAMDAKDFSRAEAFSKQVSTLRLTITYCT